MAANTTFGTRTEITVTTASLADTSSATGSTVIDLSATNHLGLEIEATLVGTSGSDQTVDLYLISSADGGTTYETTDNKRYVGSATMNTTTEVVKRLVVGNVADYSKLVVTNQSDGALSSTEGDCTFYYRAISIADA